MRSLILLPLLGMSVALAQSTLPANPPALQSAIKNIGKALERPVAAVKLLSMTSARASKVCSVAMPLIKPPDGQQFAIRRHAAVQSTESIPQVAVPAPPCEPARD
ncbi:MAG: hypothetical protein HYX27_03010 [Acidobacteria bacterium]|nr:hypothetical protein [Acidobacteriota bacterium]